MKHIITNNFVDITKFIYMK